MIAPGFDNLDPTLDNLLSLLCRIIKSFDENSIILNNKSIIMFEYYLNEGNCINIKLQCDRIVIISAKEITIQPFENL